MRTVRHTSKQGNTTNLTSLFFWLFLHVRPNYIHNTSNDIHTDGARAKTGGHKGIRGDRRFKGRGGYPMTFIQMGLGLRLGDIGNQGRQEIQGKRRIPNGDKLSLP